MDLDDYAKLVQDKACVSCGAIFERPMIDIYPHDGGWLVKGYDRRQWLSVHCRMCEYDTALWKLDIPGDVDHLPIVKVLGQ